MGKNTAIIGASANSDRYSYMATVSLKKHGHKVFPVGISKGDIAGEVILTDKPQLNDIDTVTLYVGPKNQPVWYDYILSLHPKRVIFNPGTENEEFYKKLDEKNIAHLEACTLVMLSIKQY